MPFSVSRQCTGWSLPPPSWGCVPPAWCRGWWTSHLDVGNYSSFRCRHLAVDYGHHAVGKAATAAVGVLYSTGGIVVHARSEVLLFLRLHLRFLAKIMTVVISGSHQGCWLVNPLSPPLLHPSQPPSNAPPCPLPPAHRPLEVHRVPPLPKVSVNTA